MSLATAPNLIRGEASVFLRKSFSAKSFSAKSWRFSGELPWEEAPIQPGAFGALARASSPLSKPFKRRTRARREQEMLLL